MCQHQIAVHNDAETQIVATHSDVIVRKNGLKIEIPLPAFVDFLNQFMQAVTPDDSETGITEIHVYIDGKEIG